MGKITAALLMASLLLGATAHADPSDAMASSLPFLAWLQSHAKDFGSCEPRREGDAYVLCDATRVPAARLKSLFAMKPRALADWIRAQGLKIEVLCDSKGSPGAFAKTCAPESGRGNSEMVTAQHGQYLAGEKTILVASAATPGGLIHEYLHSLEAGNANPVYGKIYGRERLAIEKSLREATSAEAAQVEPLKASGRTRDASIHNQAATTGSMLLAQFGPWQQIIDVDERSLFLLYLKFGRELGAADADLAAAKAQMALICQRGDVRPVLPASECP